jgi:hypothetical protein
VRGGGCVWGLRARKEWVAAKNVGCADARGRAGNRRVQWRGDWVQMHEADAEHAEDGAGYGCAEEASRRRVRSVSPGSASDSYNPAHMHSPSALSRSIRSIHMSVLRRGRESLFPRALALSHLGRYAVEWVRKLQECVCVSKWRWRRMRGLVRLLLVQWQMLMQRSSRERRVVAAVQVRGASAVVCAVFRGWSVRVLMSRSFILQDRVVMVISFLFCVDVLSLARTLCARMSVCVCIRAHSRVKHVGIRTGTDVSGVITLTPKHIVTHVLPFGPVLILLTVPRGNPHAADLGKGIAG